MASARRHEATNRGRPPADDVARLVAQAVDGDQLAWDALVDEFAGVVWAATRAYRLNRADAADVVQTTWMRLVQNADRIKDPTRLGAWLATTARRECLDVIHRTSRVIPRSHDLPDPPSDAPHHVERLIIEQHAVALHVACGASRRATPRCCGCSAPNPRRATGRSVRP